MNFVLQDNYYFWWPVTVRIPDPEKAGKIIEQTFEALLCPETQGDAIAADEAVDTLATIRDRADYDRTRLSRIVRDWRGVVDDAGKSVPMTPATFDVALGHSWFRAALWTAYRDALSGARAGN